MLTKEQILEGISNMSLLEINDLILMIEKKFLISSKEIIKETSDDNIEKINKEQNIVKTKFTVKLTDIGKNKISIIKIIRSMLNLGLKESKDLVESCPILVKKNLDKEEAESIKKILEESGASVIIE